MIVGAAGRLSPEKGFSVLVDAAAEVLAGSMEQTVPGPAGPALAGPCSLLLLCFVLFGDGPLRSTLEAQIEARA